MEVKQTYVYVLRLLNFHRGLFAESAALLLISDFYLNLALQFNPQIEPRGARDTSANTRTPTLRRTRAC